MPAAFILVAIVVLASYIFSPPPIARGLHPSPDSGLEWAGCAKPRNPTVQDLRDCEEWQAEKQAKRQAEERAP